jgi:PKHD-type hydroxylase
MILQLQHILSGEEVRQARAALAGAPWDDGRRTSGEQAALAKNNLQLREDCGQALAVRELVLQALKRAPLFFSAALPKRISPPMFNRYGDAANAYGNHVDAAVRFTGDGARVRTDISCTVFLSAPDEYEGGELRIEDGYLGQRIKLAAGDMILYPGNTIHRVEPVTKGERIASFFWVESMVRSMEQRRMLFDMDASLVRVRSLLGESDPASISLTGAYHDLLRMWADT